MTEKQAEALHSLVAHLGNVISKHDRAIVVIREAIELGIKTGPEIIEALHEVGFNKQHVGIWLHSGTGDDPNRHHWSRNAAGIYRNHAS